MNRTLMRLSVVLLLIPAGSSAQTITGSVRTSDSDGPIAGAIVEVRTTRHAEPVRALSDATGRFRLRTQPSDTLWLRVLRVGFLPTEHPAIVTRGRSAIDVTVIAHDMRVELASVRVTGRDRCRVRPENGLAVATAWEEARKVMLASQLMSVDTAISGSWYVYESVVDPNSQHVREQSVSRYGASTRRVFRSVPVGALIALGFVVQDTDGVRFYAPDVDVLLSEQFANTYCFRLVNGSSNRIGIRFQRVDRKDARHDIEGTVWLDRRSGEVARVEFTYTGFPVLPEPNSAGGFVEFAKLERSGWVASAWRAQIPLLTSSTTNHYLTDVSSGVNTTHTTAREIRVAGGELERLVRSDRVVFDEPRAAIRLHFVPSDGATSTTSVVASLRGSSVRGASDSTGRLRLGPLPAGRYTANIVVPTLDSLKMAPFDVTVEATVGTEYQVIRLPSTRDAVARPCGTDSANAGSAILRGTVGRPGGTPVFGATVTVDFARVDARRIGTGLVRWAPSALSALTDSRGRFQICGIPRATDLRVTVFVDGAMIERRVRIDPPRYDFESNFEIDRPQGTPSAHR